MGHLTAFADADDCPESRCFTVDVRCQGLAEPRSGRVVVSESPGPTRGTIVIFSGGGGTALWGADSDRLRKVLEEWLAAGLRVVRVQWSESWWSGAAADEGFAALACRPATIMRWIRQRVAEGARPLCVGGGSGGAAQASYLLTHYGFEDSLSLAVPWSGFRMGRIDVGCLDEDPRNEALHYDDRARRAIDFSFGYGHAASVWPGEPAGHVAGPCSGRDPGFETAFAAASISATGDYHYPNTLVWHVLAGADEVGALAHGLTYYERMLRAGSPHVRLDIVPGAPHALVREDAGLTKIRDVFLQECRFR